MWWALAVAVLVVAVAGFAVIRLVPSGDDLPEVPTASECEGLAKRELPRLARQAALILEDDSGVIAVAECEYGGYPSVYGGTSDRPDAIVRRLRQLGDVEQLENSECLEYLNPSECGEIWRYSPRDSENAFVIALEADNKAGEFSIWVDR